MPEIFEKNEITYITEFQAELSDWIRNELEKRVRGEEYDAHAETLDKINLNYLTAEDYNVWKKVKNKTITEEERKFYFDSVGEILNSPNVYPEIKRAREEFRAMISNKAIGIIFLRKLKIKRGAT